MIALETQLIVAKKAYRTYVSHCKRIFGVTNYSHIPLKSSSYWKLCDINEFIKVKELKVDLFGLIEDELKCLEGDVSINDMILVNTKTFLSIAKEHNYPFPNEELYKRLLWDKRDIRSRILTLRGLIQRYETEIAESVD